MQYTYLLLGVRVRVRFFCASNIISNVNVWVYHLFLFSDTPQMEAHFSLLVTEVSFESKGLVMHVFFKTIFTISA